MAAELQPSPAVAPFIPSVAQVRLLRCLPCLFGCAAVPAACSLIIQPAHALAGGTCCTAVADCQQHSLHFLAAGILLPSLPVGAGVIHLFPYLEAIQVLHDLQLCTTAGRQTASCATASHASFDLNWCCRADALDGQRVKAHLSDPDIESKAQAALAESATLISHNGGSKQQQQSDSKQAGVLHNFWGSALFRCGQAAKCRHPGLASTVGDGVRAWCQSSNTARHLAC